MVISVIEHNFGPFHSVYFILLPFKFNFFTLTSFQEHELLIQIDV